jgi:hypothetical protein
MSLPTSLARAQGSTLQAELLQRVYTFHGAVIVILERYMRCIDEFAQLVHCRIADPLIGCCFADTVELDNPQGLLNRVSGSFVEMESIRSD